MVITTRHHLIDVNPIERDVTILAEPVVTEPDVDSLGGTDEPVRMVGVNHFGQPQFCFIRLDVGHQLTIDVVLCVVNDLEHFLSLKLIPKYNPIIEEWKGGKGSVTILLQLDTIRTATY